MNEETRRKILSNYLSDRQVDIYMYLIYEDKIYVPDDMKILKNDKCYVKNSILSKEVEKIALKLCDVANKICSPLEDKLLDEQYGIYQFLKTNKFSYLPDKFKRDYDSKRTVKKIEFREAVSELVIYVALQILDVSEVVI